eukprot:TRINITY_DN994_c0_g1_i5.p1 TRINITY_DN994_c0_g1~~TRINITY_DN994_c0_g1_i5.p1  ORF type:complete len:629 (-),score=202.72 TRINITY_DN994_c0_g1_i5:126-2012(-)
MKFVVFLAFFGLISAALAADCSNFNGENGCQGSQTDQFPNFANRKFQTPPRGAPNWRPSYQDYSQLTGYPSVVYAADHQSAVVTANIFLKDSSATVTFTTNLPDSPSSSKTFTVTSSFKDELAILVTAQHADGSNSTLVMEPVHFVWNNVPINQPSQFKNGQKGAIVEMFGWPYADIAQECDMIGKAGYMGVKIYPPAESILSYEWLQNGELNPWWFMYQPVSYKFYSRMGDRDALRNMIDTCRAAGVRVYADAVNNHMTGGGNDIMWHRNPAGGGCATWGPKSSSALSPYFNQDFNFLNNSNTGDHPGLEFPAVPYGPMDFHCERSLSSWSDPFALNYGWLTGLADLNTESPYVRQRIADYWTDLLGMGFSGFRVDAAKHMSPDNLAAMFALLKKNMGGSLPADFITYLEVIIGGEKDLLECQYNKYDYTRYFDDAMTSAGLSQDDISKIKIWSSDYPKEFPICGYWIIPSERFAVENDCHDDQNPGSSSRDMGDKGSVLVKEKDVNKHRGFEVQLFTRTDGNWQIKLVLSSYTFMNSGAQGVPDGFSDCKHYNGTQPASTCKTVPYSKAHDSSVCGYTVYDASHNWAQGQYTRVHRDRSIIMAMRSWMGLPTNVSNAQIGLPDSCT